MNDDQIELLLDDHRGVYIPRDFAEMTVQRGGCWEGVSQWALFELEKGPEGEDYWWAWDEVLEHAWCKLGGHEWTLDQDGSLFALRDDYVWEDAG